MTDWGKSQQKVLQFPWTNLGHLHQDVFSNCYLFPGLQNIPPVTKLLTVLLNMRADHVHMRPDTIRERLQVRKWDREKRLFSRKLCGYIFHYVSFTHSLLQHAVLQSYHYKKSKEWLMGGCFYTIILSYLTSWKSNFIKKKKKKWNSHRKILCK